MTEIEHTKTIKVKFVECTVVFWYVLMVTNFFKPSEIHQFCVFLGVVNICAMKFDLTSC